MQGMTISNDGELIIPNNWETQYAGLRINILEFCAKQTGAHPEVVNVFISNVELEFWVDDAPGTDPGGTLVSWESKRQCVESLVEQTDELIEFGDEQRFPETIKVLKGIKLILQTVLTIIPDNE